MKFIRYMDDGDHGKVTIDSIYKEVYFQDHAATAGLAPHIIQISEYSDGVALFMEPLYNTLQEAIVANPKIRVKDIITEKIRELAEIGIVHNDLHGGNLMNTKADPNKWYFIDFGSASTLSNMTVQNAVDFSVSQFYSISDIIY